MHVVGTPFTRALKVADGVSLLSNTLARISDEPEREVQELHMMRLNPDLPEPLLP